MVLLALIALLPFGGAASPMPGVCVCASAAQNDGWCDVHEIGYLGGIEIHSERLFSALDAHGHELDLDTFDCAECKAAISADGFCEEHRVGFVDGLVYYSKLTHHLARGEQRDLSAVVCPVCRTNARSHGWCDTCRIGMVGALALGNKAELEKARKAFEILQAAIRALARCETCAVATFSGGRCGVCDISYGSAQK